VKCKKKSPKGQCTTTTVFVVAFVCAVTMRTKDHKQIHYIVDLRSEQSPPSSSPICQSWKQVQASSSPQVPWPLHPFSHEAYALATRPSAMAMVDVSFMVG
jgi:hypothetical protein